MGEGPSALPPSTSVWREVVFGVPRSLPRPADPLEGLFGGGGFCGARFGGAYAWMLLLVLNAR